MVTTWHRQLSSALAVPKFRLRGKRCKRFRTVNDSNDCTIYWYGGCSTIFKTIVRTWDVAKCKAVQPRRTAAVGCGPALVHIVLPYGLWICCLSWWSGFMWTFFVIHKIYLKWPYDLCIGVFHHPQAIGLWVANITSKYICVWRWRILS